MITNYIPGDILCNKIFAEKQKYNLGSLSNCMRGNLSLFTSMYYKAELRDYQENSGFREVIPR